MKEIDDIREAGKRCCEAIEETTRLLTILCGAVVIIDKAIHPFAKFMKPKRKK